MANKQASKATHKGEIDLNWVSKYLKDGVYPTGLNFTEKRMVRKRAERFCHLNGDLFYLGTPIDCELGKKSRKVLLTHAERWHQVEACHISPDGTHYGLEKTADSIVAHFHWVGIYKFIKEYIRQCPTCKERNPKMLAAANSSTSVLEESVDDMSSVGGDDVSSVCGSEASFMAGAGDAESVTDESHSEGTNKGAVGAFWEKVDMRLFGPYKCLTSTKYILMGLDSYSLWPEAFILDIVSPPTVAQSLLQMICRYGQMGVLMMTQDDDVLETALTTALEVLKKDSGINLSFTRDIFGSTDEAYLEIEDIVENFVVKHNRTWPKCLDICLLPLRISRNKRSQYTPAFLAHLREPVLPDWLINEKGGGSETQLSETEKTNAIDSLMSVHKNIMTRDFTKHVKGTKLEEDNVFTPPQPSPRKDAAVGDASKPGYVTRSRTGNAKPKSLGEETFEMSTPKRKTTSPVEVPSSRKRVKVENVAAVTPAVIEMTRDDLSDVESDLPPSEDTASKKPVDLDTYYEAIKQYVEGDGYPDNSSRSFKRLIRDQAKNYMMKDGDLYHEVGNKGLMKKIILTKEERIQLLSDTHLKASNKVQMFALLDSVHWKGKVIDCEAFLLASPHSEKSDQKSSKESLRYMAEAKNMLQYDTLDTYKEITNYIIYDVFSDDSTSKRLDHLKRQMKNFRVENGELLHVMGSRKRKVITSISERQKSIAEAFVKKGGHGDATGTFNQLSEFVYWFGMKWDVKLYVNHIENKHLLERYFLFREHHMKEPMPVVEDTDGELETDEQAIITVQPYEAVDMETTDTDVKAALVDEDKPGSTLEIAVKKPSGIFISTVKGARLPELFAAANQASVEAAVTEVTPSTESVVTVTTVADSETAYATVNTSTGDVVEPTTIPEQTSNEKADDTDIIANQPQTIIVKLNEHGEAVIIDDGQTGVATQTVEATRRASSDDITMAAVKSILQDTGAVTGSFGDIGMSTTVVGGTEVEATQEAEAPEVLKQEEGETLGDTSFDRPSVGDGSSQTYDDDDDDEDDSDSVIYDTDEDEEDGEFYEEEDSKSNIITLIGPGSPGMSTPGGEKRVVTPRQHFKCNQCDKIFFGPIKFKMHMYKHTGQKPFPCNLCNKKYTNKKSLVTHQRTHTGELPYLCSLCGKRCASKISLKSHLKCHDGKGGGFPAKCDVCDRMFSRKHLMERHKKHKHDNAQTEFKCTECSKVFGHQRSLKRHFMSAHMGVKNHVCGLCGKSFYRKEYLTGHLIQHGGAAAEGIARKPRPSTYKPRPSVFNYLPVAKAESSGEEETVAEDKTQDEPQVQRIILHQDENGQLRVVDMATEREVKRMLDNRVTRAEVGETMVVHIEEPGSGTPQVVHVEQTEEQVVEVPIEEQESYVEYQQIEEGRPEYVISNSSTAPPGGTQYIYTTSNGEIIQGNQELIYGQPAVQYEVECVGDVGDEEALSAINLLAQASAQQYETVISQI